DNTVYRNSSKPLEERVKNLLSQMTLPEKIGQMMQLDGQEDLDRSINGMHAGSLLHIQNERAAEAMDLAAKTRLGIPLLLADDCIHGHGFMRGAVVFPTQLAMACSWDPAALYKVGRITATEASCTGLHWTFSPVLDVARDLRWGRIGETFGEDLHLASLLGDAIIRGYQGEGPGDPEALLATAKHFAGYCETQGGRDASEADLTPRKLRSWFFPPFEQAVRAGCRAFMTGYQSIDGTPSTANAWLLKEVLRDEWGFTGLLVTDWDNVGRMHWEQQICADIKEASTLAVKCGNDLMMSTPSFFEGAVQAVDEGLLTEAEIDEVVSRVLVLKFEMGLFENPRRPDPKRQQEVIGCKSHREAAAEVSRKSIVLLQNRGILPLRKEQLSSIAVVGPNADDPQANLGDWAGASGQATWLMDGHPRECVTTVLDGLRQYESDSLTIRYEQGADIAPSDTNESSDDLHARAVEAAAGSDLVVAVVGDNLPLIGEECSTATLELQGGQTAMLEALCRIDTPLVVVMMNSKPLVLPKCIHDAAAILEVFNPGMAGGTAIAETLFGDNLPEGRLPISIPYHVGQQPIYYHQIRGQHGDRYADLTQKPHFPFGFGLGYTEFQYSGLNVLTPVLAPIDRFECTVEIE
ncbi:MAG: glycoside hydrolase family 3 C-terminal domain-containing protein, partial [Planctomycetes bacterium]|nr:glycoside hydrolase family 3 C-terminal domain-containing protein [Planctomycetota bacterium]